MQKVLKPPRVFTALLLVGLLHLAGWAISYHVSKTDLADWAVFAAKCFYLLCGLLLVLTQPVLGRSSDAELPPRSIGTGVVLAWSYVAASCSLLLLHASQDPQLAASVIPVNVLMQIVVASAAEELIFTVFLYSTIRHRLSFSAATLLLALVFTLLHAPTNVIAFGMRFVYMIAACILFERFRSVVAAITFHVVLNGALLLEVMLVSDASSPVFRHPTATLAIAGVAMTVTVLSSCLLIRSLRSRHSLRTSVRPV